MFFSALDSATMDSDTSFKNSRRSSELSDAEKAAESPPPTVPEGEETRKITGVRVSNQDLPLEYFELTMNRRSGFYSLSAH